MAMFSFGKPKKPFKETAITGEVTGPVWQFSRLQKTGGTSFRQHLMEGFSSNCRIYTKHFEYEMLGDPDARSYNFFVGHISPAALHEFFQDVRVLLLFRDPVQRLISAYHFWRERAHEVPDSRFFSAIASMSLLDFLTSDNPLVRNTVHNTQARLLAGGRFGMSNHSRTCVISAPMPEEDIFALAKAAVDRAYFVGITEHMDESIHRLFRKAGLTPPQSAHHANKGVSRQKATEPTPQEMDALRAATHIDRRLYDYTLSRFLEAAQPQT